MLLRAREAWRGAGEACDGCCWAQATLADCGYSVQLAEEQAKPPSSAPIPPPHAPRHLRHTHTEGGESEEGSEGAREPGGGGGV